jgi:antitoxin component YwqK of YwqJK toxin-antitoxin module
MIKSVLITILFFFMVKGFSQSHFIFEMDSGLLVTPLYNDSVFLPPYYSNSLLLREGLEDGNYYYCPDTKKLDTTLCKKEYILKGTIRNGKMDGEIVSMWRERCDLFNDRNVVLGIPRYTLSYKEGKLNGPYVIYETGNDAVSLGYYKNNRLHGKQLSLYKRDFFPFSVIDAAEYQNGKLIEYEDYYENGNIRFWKSYDTKHDTGEAIFYYTSEIPKIMGYFEADTLRRIEYFNIDGSLLLSVSGLFSNLHPWYEGFKYPITFDFSSSLGLDYAWMNGQVKLENGAVHFYKEGKSTIVKNYSDMHLEKIFKENNIKL